MKKKKAKEKDEWTPEKALFTYLMEEDWDEQRWRTNRWRTRNRWKIKLKSIENN